MSLGWFPPLRRREVEGVTRTHPQVHDRAAVFPRAEPTSKTLRWVAKLRWSLPRGWARTLTLGIRKAPPRTRTVFHVIKLKYPDGSKVSECSELAPTGRMRGCDRCERSTPHCPSQLRLSAALAPSDPPAEPRALSRAHPRPTRQAAPPPL